MINGKQPNPNVIHPIKGYDKEIYIKPAITNPNIIVGDFSYIADSDFESHVTHHYAWNGDKLIIGRFCQIAAGVEFVMNGANHQMNAVTTFPFYTLEGWDMEPPAATDMPLGATYSGSMKKQNCSECLKLSNVRQEEGPNSTGKRHSIFPKIITMTRWRSAVFLRTDS